MLNKMALLFLLSLFAPVIFPTFRALKPDCQLLFFSATYEAQVMSFATNVVSDAVVIRLRKEEESLDNIKQFYVECNSADSKYEALANLYGALTIGQTMVFCHVGIKFSFSI